LDDSVVDFVVEFELVSADLVLEVDVVDAVCVVGFEGGECEVVCGDESYGVGVEELVDDGLGSYFAVV